MDSIRQAIKQVAPFFLPAWLSKQEGATRRKKHELAATSKLDNDDAERGQREGKERAAGCSDDGCVVLVGAGWVLVPHSQP